MPELSRRVFLSSGAGVAAAGVAIAAMPGLATAASASPPSPAEAAAVAVTIEQLNATGPPVVHVRDAAAGEISVMSGENEVVFNDPSFIARIVSAANGNHPS